MNKQPMYYLQNDARWKSKPYQVKGETATIGGSGCGPSCAAMLIETLTGKTYTPEDACNWSMTHGYKAMNQGTYYSYFKPQFAEFGIDCEQLNNVSLYGNPTAATHTLVEQLLQEGWYIIACMGPGTWTSSGHFVVLWWEDEKMRINDPASTSTTRTSGDPATFRKQVKYYWKVDARSYNVKPLDIAPMNTTGAVTASTLNIRSGPSTSYSVIGGLTKGCTITITGSYNGWYKIQSGSADNAWVFAQYVTINSQTKEKDMTKEETQKLIDESLKAAQPTVYTTVETVPGWAQDAVKRAVETGIIKGDNNGKLHLTDDNLITIQMLSNAKIF